MAISSAEQSLFGLHSQETVMTKFWEFNHQKCKQFAKTRIDKFCEHAFLPDVKDIELDTLKESLLYDFRMATKGLRRISKIPKGAKNRDRAFRLFCKSYFQRTMLVLAMYNNPNRLKALDLSFQDFLELPSKLCMVTGQSEKFVLYDKLKSSGTGTRPICEFGNIRYTQQCGVKTILEAITPPLEYVYGAQDAVLKIGDSLASGKFHVITTDIQNSHSSITKTHVRELCLLDDRLIRYVVFPSVTYSNTCYHAQKEASQTLLPQGGASSALIQSLVIDRILRQMPKMNEIVIASADNMAICSETPQGAKKSV